ncbi:hypothetical protein CDAR_31501 [Caerostris darwini]|uniref:Uncharacterized protein n=1 Tax=Caerostris darwini TaxID=1538125 RepID=A0AAV4QCY9_9ARAC|nr:hypothetical protein CDAR_31501 [Caerostris darwini]
MSQSSSGLTDLTSPESPPLHEQGLPRDPQTATPDVTEMDTSQTVTAEQLSSSDFLFSHPAPHRLSDPTPEHLLYFEVLLKEAAALMVKVSKHQSAANNIKSPTWERASLTIEDCSKRIRAICTYTGIPASHLPTKKELSELKKAKELQLQLEAEAAAKEAIPPPPAPTPPPPAPVLPEQSDSIEPPEQPTSTKRKSPTSDDDEEGFQTVINKKDRKRPTTSSKPVQKVPTRTQPTTFTSRSVQPEMAFSQILRQGNEEKSAGPAPQPIVAREPLSAAITNSSAPAKPSSECSLSEIFQCLMDLVRDNPSHSQIILQAFGLAKDKMRNSLNRFDMTYHLFEAYTDVLSESQFLTA